MRYTAQEARETAQKRVSTAKILDEIFLIIRDLAETGDRSLHLSLIGPTYCNITWPMIDAIEKNPEPLMKELERLGYETEIIGEDKEKYLIIKW